MWRIATNKDIDRLCDLFWNNITNQKHYISHGEIQMGVAIDSETIATDGKQKWRGYVELKIANQSKELPSTVLIKDNEQGDILAFCILEVSEDGDKPFGVICDMVVIPELRGKGVGKEMFNEIMSWFNSMKINDIYLESGVGNHSAHHFFESLGFQVVSKVFKLQ